MPFSKLTPKQFIKNAIQKAIKCGDLNICSSLGLNFGNASYYFGKYLTNENVHLFIDRNLVYNVHQLVPITSQYQYIINYNKLKNLAGELASKKGSENQLATVLISAIIHQNNDVVQFILTHYEDLFHVIERITRHDLLLLKDFDYAKYLINSGNQFDLCGVVQSNNLKLLEYWIERFGVDSIDNTIFKSDEYGMITFDSFLKIHSMGINIDNKYVIKHCIASKNNQIYHFLNYHVDWKKYKLWKYCIKYDWILNDLPEPDTKMYFNHTIVNKTYLRFIEQYGNDQDMLLEIYSQLGLYDKFEALVSRGQKIYCQNPDLVRKYRLGLSPSTLMRMMTRDNYELLKAYLEVNGKEILNDISVNLDAPNCLDIIYEECPHLVPKIRVPFSSMDALVHAMFGSQVNLHYDNIDHIKIAFDLEIDITHEAMPLICKSYYDALCAENK